ERPVLAASTPRENLALAPSRPAEVSAILPPDREPREPLGAAVFPTLVELATRGAPRQRHESLVAFLNLAMKAGKLGEMRDVLAGPGVYHSWVRDGSRTPDEWRREVDRWTDWVATHPTPLGRGWTFLREQGYVLPALNALPGPGGVAENLPSIVLSGVHTRHLAQAVEAALAQANHPPRWFTRDGQVIELEDETRRLVPLDAIALTARIERAANLYRLAPDGNLKAATAPLRLAQDLLSRPASLPFPRLRRVTAAPTFTRDGQLLAENGFDHPTGTLVKHDLGEGAGVLQAPDEALGHLLDVLQDFPFETEAGLAHALAATLLPFIRDLIDGPTPLFLIDAPTRGSGKTLLATLIATIATGKPAGVTTLTTDNAETEKRITSLLMDDPPVILLDNVHRLAGDALAAALTSRTWKGRKLGQSLALNLPNNALWLATGNNVTLDDDLPRRVIPIRLDPRVERPETRSGFRIPRLLQHAQQNRLTLVNAALTLVQTWLDANQPAGNVPELGGFEDWTRVTAGILTTAGMQNFLQNREPLYTLGNPHADEWTRALQTLAQTHGQTPFTAREATQTLRDHALLPELWTGEAGQAVIRVGKALVKQRDRVYGGLRVRVEGTSGPGRCRSYRIEPLTAA
ncbi:MAG TPA: hypothetical protein VHN99_03330, partial [Deinococcales bacterium]|nr:hypothetical protein [Deinococcales bacterium]